MPKLVMPEPPSYSKGRKPVSGSPSLFRGSRFFGFLDDILQKRLADAALHPTVLARLEPELVRLKSAYDSGDYSNAIAMAGRVKASLGQFFLDQDPAGWLVYCEGACHLELGELSLANECFHNAFRAIAPIDSRLIRLGLARASETPDSKRSYLMASYLSDPDWLSANSTSAEMQLVKEAIRSAEAGRQDDGGGPSKALDLALEARFAQEVRAFQLSDEAAKFRSERHILCDEDEKASRQINLEYREVLMKWFTAPRNPDMGSFGSQPFENPNELHSSKIIRQSSDTASIEAVFGANGLESKYRYVLHRATLPLGDLAAWRIHEVWSLWDDGDIQLH